ncbi:MAG: hypothetical protein EU539_13385 [Promethearchaeota archaeon]|nr:MAG: hypothetical protein EU539_13385 [Candidatus Lokiarchaeota archaeon]
MLESNEFLDDIFQQLDNLLKLINNGIITFFFYLKWIFVFILIAISALTLCRLRGIYLTERIKEIEKESNQLRRPRFILGLFYLFLAFGIAFNFFIYFMIWINNFLPPPLIFQILDSVNPDFYNLNRIKNYNKSENEFEKSIHLVFALASFEAFLHLILTIWYLVNNNRSISNPRKVIHNLLWSLAASIFFGFLTFTPFFL